MLQVKHLTISHLTNLTDIVRDLSFTVNPGDKVAIIGSEGNGKSTLLKWIMGDKKIEHYLKIKGELVNQFSRVVYLPQFLPTECEQLSIDQYFFEDASTSELDYALLYQLVGPIGFEAERLTSSQKLVSLSGGEKIKIQLLKALATNPDLILLDEPSNDLDLPTIEWLEYFIQSTPLTVLYISHDEALLKATATKIIQLELLQQKSLPVSSVESLTYQEYIEQKQARYNQQRRIALKQREEYSHQMEAHRRIESSVHHAQASISRQDPGGARLLKKKMHNVKSQGRRFERQKENFQEIPLTEDPILVKFSNTQLLPANKNILHIVDQTLQHGEQLLAENLNLFIKGPQKIGIIGQNGVGKSTWLKQLWQQLETRQDISVGYMPQRYADYLPMRASAIEFLSESGEKEELTQVMTYLGSMRFTTEEMHQPIENLSGGQQAKLLLIKIDLSGHNVLLLDEPTRNFSPLSQPELRQLFLKFPGALITISHDRSFLAEVCDTIYELTPNGFIQTELSIHH